MYVLFNFFSCILYLLREVKHSAMIHHYVRWKLSAEIKSHHYRVNIQIHGVSIFTLRMLVAATWWVRMRLNDVAKEGKECLESPGTSRHKEQNLPARKSHWKECSPADTCILDFRSPELWKKRKISWYFKPPGCGNFFYNSPRKLTHLTILTLTIQYFKISFVNSCI